MDIKVSKKKPEHFNGDLVVYIVSQPDKNKAPKSNKKDIDRVISKAFTIGDFKGKTGETLIVYPELTKHEKLCHKVERVLVAGIGNEELSREDFRICGGNIAKKLAKINAPKVMIVIPESLAFPLSEMSECLVEGLILGSYKFQKYKNDQEKNNSKYRTDQITICSSVTNSARKGVAFGKIAANATCFARDMANEPGSYFTPDHFASLSLEIAKRHGLKRKVLGKSELVRLKMGGILGVNRGTSASPKLVMLEYRTGKKVPVLMFVGKGLTFDSGGISLKPSAGMEDMKYDMCGGAAVLAAMDAIGYIKPKNVDVVAVIPTTDNMPGPDAIKPGDIVKHYNGKSVEVINTDAEGRLILADALSYGIKKFKPTAVVDIATLTGAVIIALGHHKTGLMSNDDKLVKSIVNAGERSAEPLWRLPLGKEYTKQLKSKIADLKNIGGKGGGTITAGAFLQEFVGETNWAHMDIAGTAWGFTEKSYIPKGPSGTGVRTIIELVRAWK